MTIIPTIFAHNKKEFDERFNKLLPISRDFQIDFMDGKFVKAKSVQLKDIPHLPKNKSFEAHLMCKNPEKYFSTLKKKGFKKIIFHIESTSNPEKVISQSKIQTYIAINPETPIKKILPLISKIDGVLFMGVHPGKEHQKFIPEVYKKIATLRAFDSKIKTLKSLNVASRRRARVGLWGVQDARRKKHLDIQVDGGVNLRTAPKLAKLGVNALNSGSFIADAENPKQMFKKLNDVFNGKRRK